MISINASDLRSMFQQVTPHMSDDDYLPVVHTVRLEVRDGWLYAITTDRFTVGVARRPVGFGAGNRAGHLPGRLVPAVTAWLDGASEAGETVTLSLSANGVTTFRASSCGGLNIDSDPSAYEKFPDWRKILHAALIAEPCIVPTTGFTTRFLARWQHADEKLAAWQQAPNKPVVLLSFDGRFAGLQMPVRNEETRDNLAAEWIPATASTATVDGTTYDLDETWQDAHGDPWTYSGENTPDGMPLMVIEGIEDDPHPLDRLIAQYGPLQAAR